MVITGIGSRQTPANILSKMTQIGKWARENRVWVRSGHADGADWAFESGAQNYCIGYLPWAGFNTHLKSAAKQIVPDTSSFLSSLVYKYHPAPHMLSSGAFKLMCRNGAQVLGAQGNNKSHCVICWTPDGEHSGGTGQALRIARFNAVPVFNLFTDSITSVMDFLKTSLIVSF